MNLHPVVPIVFLGQPSPKALQAAGIVASWFGILTDSAPVRFPVSIGTIPSGQCDCDQRECGRASRLAEDQREQSGPTIAMRTNPTDPYSKVLVLTGDNPDDLLIAASALALQRDMFQATRYASLR